MESERCPSCKSLKRETRWYVFNKGVPASETILTTANSHKCTDVWHDYGPNTQAAPSPISYHPRGDRVVIKQHERPEPAAAEEGKLLMPTSQQKPLYEGTVVSVGPKVDDIKPGQHVCFLEFAGEGIEIDGERYLSMREQEIHGIRK